VSEAGPAKRKECAMKRMKIRAWSSLTIVLAVVWLVAACATTNTVRVLHRVGVPLYQPTEPTAVMVLQGEPSRPFEVLGQIIIEPQADLPVPDIERMLRREAARMGANAVVILSDMTMRVGESREEMAGGQVVVANAIRYRD
jgi:hypothetical protein